MQQLYLLGEAHVLVAGAQQRPGPKMLAAMAYLALEGKSPRRLLAQRLWPESSDPLNNFAVARNALTKQLGVRVLLDDADKVELVEFNCDVNIWRENIARGNLEMAWNAWRGEFMRGFQLSDWEKGLGEEFEEWLETTREQLNNEKRELAIGLASQHLRAKQYSQAIPYLESACEQPEPVEDTSRWLLLCCGALGMLDKASATYTKLSRQLREELGVEPTQETQTVFAWVRAGENQSCQDALTFEFGQVPTLERMAAKLPAPQPTHKLPLIGRQAEFKKLLENLEAAQQKNMRLAIVQAEPGAGKTRLAEELLSYARKNNCFVLRSVATTTGVPLAAVASLVEDALQQNQNSLPNVLRNALTRLLPNTTTLNRTKPSDELSNNPDNERHTLFEAARQVVQHPNKTTVLFLDDAQWADQASLEFLLHLVRNPNPNGQLILLCMRNTEPPYADTSIITKPHGRENLGANIKLAPLNTEACTELCKTLKQNNLNGEQLQRQSGGNALYAIEMLLAEPGTASRRVEDLLRYRIEDLTDHARQVLEVVAIMGNGINTGLLRRTSGRSLEEIVSAIEELSRTGLLRPDHSINHDLTREVVLADLQPARTQLLHLRAARVCTGAPIPAAQHYWTAKDLWEDNDTGAALGAMLEAGTNIANRGALAEGLVWFERALEVAPNANWRVKALSKKAHALENFNRHKEAISVLERAEVLLADADDLAKIEIWNLRGRVAVWHLGDTLSGLLYAKKSLGLLQGLAYQKAHLAAIETHSLLGRTELIRKNFVDARRHYQESLRISLAIGAETTEANACMGLGAALDEMNKDEALDYLTRALNIWQTNGDAVKEIQALNSIAIFYSVRSKFNEAEAHYQKMLDLRQALGGITSKMVDEFVWGNLGALRFRQSKYGEAKQHYEREWELVAANGNKNDHFYNYFNRAEVCMYLGNLEECEQLCLEALKQFDEANNAAWVADLLWLQAEVQVLKQDYEEAEVLFGQSVQLAGSVGYASRQALALSRLARLKGSPELAQESERLWDSVTIKATGLALAGKPTEAIKQILTLDAYEEARLLLDVGRLQHNAKLQKQGVQLLRHLSGF